MRLAKIFVGRLCVCRANVVCDTWHVCERVCASAACPRALHACLLFCSLYRMLHSYRHIDDSQLYVYEATSYTSVWVAVVCKTVRRQPAQNYVAQALSPSPRVPHFFECVCGHVSSPLCEKEYNCWMKKNKKDALGFRPNHSNFFIQTPWIST
jgi:hypothetical protein